MSKNDLRNERHRLGLPPYYVTAEKKEELSGQSPQVARPEKKGSGTSLENILPNVLIELRKLGGETLQFIGSSPLRFSISVVFTIVYALEWWVFTYELGYQYNFPSPPFINLPFLGAPYDWDYSTAGTRLLVMSIIWVGAVKVFARNKNQGK